MSRTPLRPESRSAPATALVKSRDRVRDLAEVYTPGSVIQDMLDLLGRQSKARTGHDISRDAYARFLEPSCGNGNFLEAILSRKLATIRALQDRQQSFEFRLVRTVASIYGIDIDDQNVAEARERLATQVISHYSRSRWGSVWKRSANFDATVRHVLATNIVRGDALHDAAEITLVEYSLSEPRSKYPFHLNRRHYRLATLLSASEGAGMLGLPAAPITEYGPTHFLDLRRLAPERGGSR